MRGNLEAAQWLGLNIFFYVFLPSLVIMGIWAVVKELSRDHAIETENDMIRVDVWLFSMYLYRDHHVVQPIDPPSFKGWREPIRKNQRLVQHMEQHRAG